MSQENLSLGFQTRSDTNWTVQSQKMARDCTYWIKEEEELYYICCENIGAVQLICVFGFSYAKSRFSHHAAHIFTHFSLLRGLSTFCGWLEIKTGLLMTRLLYNWFMSHENWQISFCWSAVFDVNNVQSSV